MLVVAISLTAQAGYGADRARPPNFVVILSREPFALWVAVVG